jgi:hypothetical protein
MSSSRTFFSLICRWLIEIIREVVLTFVCDICEIGVDEPGINELGVNELRAT